MKTKRIIALSALSLLFVAQSVAQTTTTAFTDYIPKGATYLFECSRIPFTGGDKDTTIGSTTLQLRERQTPFTIAWQDSVVRGATYLYGCDRFTTDTEVSDTIRGWERDTIYTFSLKVLEPKRDTGEVLLRDTICSGRKYLFGCEIIDTDSIFTTDSITTLWSEYWQSFVTADTLYKLQLAVLPVYIDTVTNPTQTACDSVRLNGTMFYRDTVFTDTIVDQTTGCRTILRYSATVNHSKDTVITATICEGSGYPFGDDTLTIGGTYTRITETVSHCDSTITLSLTVTPRDTVVINDTICQEGSGYQFGDTTLTTEDTYYRTVSSLVTGCDSVIELRLAVQSCLHRGEVFVIDTVCPAVEYQGRLTSHTITEPTSWMDSVRVSVDGMPTDSLYHYTITPYLLTLPVIPEDSIIVYCGRAIDITKANDMVQGHIAALGDLYAPNAFITWQMSDNNAWRNLPDTTAIPGGVHTVSVRCTVTSDCGQKNTTLTLSVVTPSPENDPTMGDVDAAGSLYGNRLLLVNKHVIDSIYGWNIQPEHVVWYRMKGAEPNVAADDSVHTGLYYTTDKAFEGSYYARIKHISTIASDCGGTLRTVILRCQKQSNVAAPQLTPTIARPAEQIRLFNLDAGSVTEIRVYNTAGELQSTYTSAEATEFLFHAAQSAGYYLVDVLTEDSKVTLRYIVK